MSKSNTVKNVSAMEVRAWASKKGLCAGRRGRLSLATIAAFNKAHKVRRYDLTDARLSEIERRQLASA